MTLVVEIVQRSTIIFYTLVSRDCLFIVFFFFSSRRRHTRFKCDWSSDVCSSDLNRRLSAARPIVFAVLVRRSHTRGKTGSGHPARIAELQRDIRRRSCLTMAVKKIGRASCRERV